MRHQRVRREDVPRLAGPAEVLQDEAGAEALPGAELRAGGAAAAAAAAVRAHAVLRVPDAGRGPAVRAALLQGHGHAGPLLHEEDAGHDPDRVPLLRQQQLPGLVRGAVDQQPVPGHEQRRGQRVSTPVVRGGALTCTLGLNSKRGFQLTTSDEI